MTRNNSTELYGLVLLGGQSKRMRKDKASLKYYGQPQWRVCHDLLLFFCEKVFLSTREEKRGRYRNYPQIPDLKKYNKIGPLAGILSAFAKYPHASWLVLACDLPFVTGKTLRTLLDKRNAQKIATAFKSVHDGLPEPLCAIYEPKARAQMLKFLKKNIHCPRKILINSDVKLLKLTDKTALDNVNDPREFKQALRKLKK